MNTGYIKDMRGITLDILDEWRDRLAAVGLDDFDRLLAFRGGKCCSEHPRGATWRTTLPGGEVIFVKQDYYTKFQPVLRALVRLRRPQTNTEKECAHIAQAAAMGFRVPLVIAHSRHDWWRWPSCGVMVELALEGRPLDVYLAATEPTAEEKERALANARNVLTRLQDAGLDWGRDCKPEHFMVGPRQEIALLDLERLYLRRAPLSPEKRAAQFARFDSLLPKG